ncbi:hypothetical protein OIE68_46515 [Nocardia vinacea]|uniref:Uncharacterized protein n=1 Tax=Nocardia vinacea TaxID=96468 RepID=A0ABZ1YPR9_9NOCA|nr:hypothetical protein OIE68_46515 [Nocardia vinacea]
MVVGDKSTALPTTATKRSRALSGTTTPLPSVSITMSKTRVRTGIAEAGAPDWRKRCGVRQ